MADSSRIISLYFDGQKKVITTNASTVNAALEEADVHLGKGDLVEPSLDTPIPDGFFNVNVYRSRPVVVVDGARKITVETSLQSPVLIAKAAGLTVFPEDDYRFSTIEDIAALGTVGQMVTIKRATPVILKADSVQQIVRTQQSTVGGLLDERDVALGPEDTVTQSRNTPISANMVVQINRVKVVIVKQDQAIARATQKVKDDTLTAGTSRVETEGSDGRKELTFRVHFQNGVEQGRELLSTVTVEEPVQKVIKIGTKIDYSADPVALGKQLAAQRGWVDDQWTALYKLWEQESKWNPNAKNYWSGACGIPQAYPCSKIPDHSTAGQINWGLSYIAGKYGDPATAWAYWQRNHSY